MAADQSATIHYGRDPLQSLAKLDIVDSRVDHRKRAEDPFGFDTLFEWRVALWIEGLRLRHTSPHPEQDHAVRSWLDLFRTGDQTRFAAQEGRCGCTA